MKNLTFQKLFFTTMLVMTTTFFVGCVDDNDDTEAPRLEISPKTLVFDEYGTPVDGSQNYFEISANRSWKATVLDDKTWVTLSKMEGEGSDKVQVSIPEGITDEAKIQIQISNKVGVLMKEVVTIRSGNVVPAVEIYNETFGTASQEGQWPLVSNFTGWITSGEGSDNVSYENSGNVSIRQSGKLSSGYEGASGDAKVFFGTNSPVFIVKGITLKADQTNLKLGFGASYSVKIGNTNNYDNEFKPESFHVYLSKDGTTWSDAIQYDFKQADEFWGYVTSNFTLREATSTIYVKFVADIESGFAIDDVTLSTGNGGQEITLGGGGPEEPATEITIPALNAMMTTSGDEKALEASYYFEAVVQNDVTGGNYSFNNLILATENATEAGNGITIYDGTKPESLVEPSLHDLDKGDKVKITLRKSLAKVKNYNGMHELVGTGDWITIEKLTGKATITPVKITVDKLADYQGMAVTIENVTNPNSGVWTTEDNLHSHEFKAAGNDFIVFCKKGAAAFVNQTFKATIDNPVSISGLAAVNSNKGQLVPRNLDDTQAFNAVIPLIVSVSPTSLSFTAEGGKEDIEVTVANFDGKTIKTDGLSGILNVAVSGTKVAVTASANANNTAVQQTLKLSVEGGNEIEIPVTVEGKPSGNETIITLDLTMADNYPDNFPVGATQKKTEAAMYKFGEYDYTVSPSSSGAYYQIANKGKVYIFFGKKGAYIELPAIPDKKLTKVTLTSHADAAKATKLGIADSNNTIVKGGEGITKDENHKFTYNLSETTINTKYRIYIVTEANSQIGGWTLVYE